MSHCLFAFLLSGFLIYGCGPTGSVDTSGEIVTDVTITLELVDKSTGASTTSISADNPGVLRITVKDTETGAAISQYLVTVATTKGILDPEDGTTITSSSGVATIDLLSGSSSGAGEVTSTVVTSTGSFSNNLAFQIASSSSATASVLSFVSSDPTTIALKGTGGSGRSENSVVKFKLLDEFGQPVDGGTVNFELTTTVGGLSLTTASAQTGSDGQASTIVKAGNTATTVRVRATHDIDANTSVQTLSGELSVSTGLPDQNSFSISASLFNPEAWSNDGEEVSITIRAADHFNNPVPDGTTVFFTAEGGAIDPSCATSSGSCSVTWRSQAPRPVDGVVTNSGRVTVLATVIGEESFTNVGDSFFTAADEVYWVAADNDLSEAFLDNNEDGGFDTGAEEFRDINSNDRFDSGNGIFNGTLCLDADAAKGICSNDLVEVRDSLVLAMSASSATFTFSPTSVDLVTNASQSVQITVADTNGNSMPGNTTIVAETSNGTLVGATSFTILTNTISPYTFSVLVDREETANSKTTGVLTITVTTPKSEISTGSITVTDGG